MSVWQRVFFFVLIVNSIITCGYAEVMESGGPLLPEQAAYDVTFYDLNLRFDLNNRSISGFLTVEATVLDPLSVFVLDLNSHFTVDSVLSMTDDRTTRSLSFDHRQEGSQVHEGRIWIDLPGTVQAGEKLVIRVHYRGVPKFNWWSDYWVNVSCEREGGDRWWPCKDHPSDEPDSVAMHFTVPQPLICVSNGKQVGVTENMDGTRTYDWFVSTPINNYNVTFYIAGYQTIEYDYQSVTGETIPVTIWVVPASYDRAVSHAPQFLDHLRFLEETCGPYPFRADKYGVAQTQSGGMEHQTIIDYGYGFKDGPDGFDWLHFHELAHEWWGNMVTAEDWSDAWIHEGFACYMEALYAEHLGGMEKYHEYIEERSYWSNTAPIAPEESVTMWEAFRTGAVYYKAQWMIHTLRYYLGDETFFQLLRRWAYPDPSLESVTDGGQCRLASTDEFIQIAEDMTGMELSWFFEVYLRQVSLPLLKGTVENDTLSLVWEIENDIPFHLPVEVVLDGSVVRVDMTGGSGKIGVTNGGCSKIDPHCWILMEPAIIEGLGGWATQQSGTRNHLYSIDFPKPDVGIAVGSFGTIVASTDGGETWDSRISGTSRHLFSVDFADANAGWIVGSSGIILKTTDGGNQWVEQTSGTHSLLLSVDFIDANTGWAVGSSGTILKTTNGGTSWHAQNSATSNTLWSVTFTDAGTGWVVGDDGTVLKTFNGGTSWYAQNSGISKRLRSVDFIDAALGCAVGNGGTVLKTTNGGDAWLPVTVGTTEELCCVHFTDPDTGWVVGGDGVILHTTDGGATWLSQTSGTSDDLYSVYTINTKAVRAVGTNGTMLVKQLADVDPPAPPDDDTPIHFTLFQNYPNPFNTSTTIRFDLPESGHVILRIYNLIGQEVETLIDGQRKAGCHDVAWDASDFSSGVYLCRLEIGEYIKTKKLILQR